MPDRVQQVMMIREYPVYEIGTCCKCHQPIYSTIDDLNNYKMSVDMVLGCGTAHYEGKCPKHTL